MSDFTAINTLKPGSFGTPVGGGAQPPQKPNKFNRGKGYYEERIDPTAGMAKSQRKRYNKKTGLAAAAAQKDVDMEDVSAASFPEAEATSSRSAEKAPQPREKVSVVVRQQPPAVIQPLQSSKSTTLRQIRC